MTDKLRLALLREAIEELKLTGQGHIQWVKGGKKGGHWKQAMESLHRLEADLKPSPVPPLGPVWVGGKSVLYHDLTHATAGIPLFPAFDDGWVQGRIIIACEPMEVISPPTGSSPGYAFYALGRSKIEYWYGHLDRTHSVGTRFSKGDAVGRIIANYTGGGPHVHVGLNIERIAGKGKQLLHHTDYSHGAPTVGEQLRRLLA